MLKQADIQYGSAYNNYTRQEQKLLLDLYTPPLSDKRTSRPAFVLIHGGSFVGGDKAQSQSYLATALAQRGFVAASINYRLTGKFWGVDPSNASTCCPGTGSDQYARDAAHDLKAAVRFMRANAQGYGVVRAQQHLTSHLHAEFVPSSPPRSCFRACWYVIWLVLRAHLRRIRRASEFQVALPVPSPCCLLATYPLAKAVQAALTIPQRSGWSFPSPASSTMTPSARASPAAPVGQIQCQSDSLLDVKRLLDFDLTLEGSLLGYCTVEIRVRRSPSPPRCNLIL